MIQKLKFSIVLFIVCFTQNSYAQSFCGTDPNTPNILGPQNGVQRTLTTPASNYVIRIFLHIMRRSDGTGGQTSTEVNTALTTLVNDFQSLNICISLLGKDEILNDTYYNISDIHYFTLDYNGDGKFDNFSPNAHSNAIDIYLFADDKINNGSASNIQATALVIGGTLFGSVLPSSHALSHEVGHCLGLYHTYHGCETGVYEYVNGTNSSSAGDFITDTPADPNLYPTNINTSTCAWNGVTCNGPSHDANGDTYLPNFHLIMSAIPVNCMQNFTTGQGSRMRNVIANSTLLQNIIVPSDLTENGVTVTYGQDILYSALNSVSIQNSSVNSGGALTLSAESFIDMLPGFYSYNGSLYNAFIKTQCSTIDRNNSARLWLQGTGNSEPVNEQDVEKSNAFHIYPNPLSSVTSIQYTLSDLTTVSISLINANGIKVKNLKVQELQDKGNYEVQYDLSSLPSGIYYCVFEKNEIKSENYSKVYEKIIKL